MQQGLLVGLTGQTGAGKTLVSKVLSSRGFRVIDADIVARQVVAQGAKCTLELALEFGIGILNTDGTLDRKKLGSIVFSDREKRIKLNHIIFPHIQEEIFSQVEQLRLKGEQVIILDAPTLIESGTHKKCDRVVSVIAPMPLRLARIMERDKITEEEAVLRIRAQHGDEYYTSHSNFVINNDGDMSELRVKVMELIDYISPGTAKE